MTIVQKSGSDLFPNWSVVASNLGTDGSSTLSNYYGLELTTVQLSGAWSNWVFTISAPLEGDELVIVNNTPSICTIDNWPLVERIISGIGQVEVRCRGTKLAPLLDFQSLPAATKTTVTGFTEDSVGEFSWGIIEPLLVVGGDAAIFSGGIASGDDRDFRDAVKNPSCWASDFDLTGIVAWNSNSAAKQTGTAITRRHVLFATHYTPPVGTTLRWIDADGNAVDRTILAYNSGFAPNTGAFNGNAIVFDKAVAVLSSPLPDEVSSYPVVGEWIRETFASSTLGMSFVEAWVGICVDRHRNCKLAGRFDTYPEQYPMLVSGTYGAATVSGFIRNVQTIPREAVPLPDFLTEYSARLWPDVVGDSGTPRFFPLSGNSLALVGCVTYSDGGADFLNADILNACIASADATAGVSTGLTVTVAPDPTL